MTRITTAAAETAARSIDARNGAQRLLLNLLAAAAVTTIFVAKSGDAAAPDRNTASAAPAKLAATHQPE